MRLSQVLKFSEIAFDAVMPNCSQTGLTLVLEKFRVVIVELRLMETLELS